MEQHVERMLKEQEDLSEKIEKLDAFISGNSLFKCLLTEEQEDMKIQLQAMKIYGMVLNRRIERAIK